MMRFWPATDRAQLDYERLREMALAGTSLIDPRRTGSNTAVCWHLSGDRARLGRS